MRILAVFALIAGAALAGTIAAKLHSRWKANCANVPCAHLQIRLAAFQHRIAARPKTPTYLIIGDSLTEIGSWRPMCGLDPFAAGISAARSDTWLPHAKPLADAVKPDVVVLALGINDVLTLDSLGSYEELVASLAGYHLVAVPIHVMPQIPGKKIEEVNGRIAKVVPRTAEAIVAKTTDGIHLTAEDHVRWFAAIEKAVCSGR
jgi:hypothetical protein